MGKKKKTALKPLVRGFATTSQPKKVEPVVEPEEEEAPPVKQPTVGAGDEGAQQPERDDWDEGEKLEEARLQGYVDRLQEKGDKEVSRILKVSHQHNMTAARGLGYMNIWPVELT